MLLTHELSLGQAFAHCPRFLTAAPRKSLGLVSVLMWPAVLPNQLRIIGLVSPSLTNYLNLQSPISKRLIFHLLLFPKTWSSIKNFILYFEVGTTVLLTRSPLFIFKNKPFDSHVLSTIPAFIQDQDQVQFVFLSKVKFTFFALLTFLETGVASSIFFKNCLKNLCLYTYRKFWGGFSQKNKGN